MNSVTLAILLVLLMSGCTMYDKTITQEQADARVNQLIRDTAAALTPRPRLELIPYGTGADNCLAADAPEGMVSINRAYWLRDIPKSENLNISRQVKAHWQAQGHRIVAVGTGNNPDLNAESNPDHFILGLSWAKGDNLYLASTSTCVWPDGTPPAKTGR
ncbi:hypothetical protein [Nonomuraea africana]|uniref:hypothetical protein n=1 Tax=Nonomuraea africana TaxID=46171 RepID=UPI003411AC20